MKKTWLGFMFLTLLFPMTAWSATWEWNETGYVREEATGFLRNTTGIYQGPGAGTGLTYGPLARLLLPSGFTVAEVGKWYAALGSRVGGDAAPEGSKLSLTVGVAPLTVMGVSVIVGYNVVDGAATWGAVTSLNGLWNKLNQ